MRKPAFPSSLPSFLPPRPEDTFAGLSRSVLMSRIRGSGNKCTEDRLARLFRAYGLKGWRKQAKLPGTPDFAFAASRVTIFVDGCFWHGCPKCYQPPNRNKSFWVAKVARNRRRDRRVGRELREEGWKVLRVWECVLRRSSLRVASIIRSVADRAAGASPQ